MVQHEVKVENSRTNGSLIDGFVERINAAQNPQEVVSIIEKIVEEPCLYVYAQFLHLGPVAALLGTEFEKFNNLLKLFTYGEYKTYVDEKNCLPPLTPAMIEHLRRLTIVSMGEKQQTITYNILQGMLDLRNFRELEALIIETIALGLIKGMLDQEKRCIEVYETVARDVRSEEVPIYIDTLRGWFKRSDHILETIEKEIQQANKLADESRDAQQDLNERIEAAKCKDISGPSYGQYGLELRKRDDKSKRCLNSKYSRGFRTPKTNKKD